MGQINTASAAGEGTYSESGFWDSDTSATPSATATGGGITTPTPVPTPTKRPAVTAKPKADISLKNEFQNVVLTVGTTGEFDIESAAALHLYGWRIWWSYIIAVMTAVCFK